MQLINRQAFRLSCFFQLHEITKIQKRHLVAIEEGNYDVLPGAFYARAFIKQYADAVGLNGEELLVEYQSTIPQSEKRDVPQVSTGQKTQETNQITTPTAITNSATKIFGICSAIGHDEDFC
ncbi:helix-turn-helix domain-containing protein, partial [Bacillus sp. B-TM1]